MYDLIIDTLNSNTSKNMDYFNTIIQALKICEVYLLYCTNDISSIYLICDNLPTQNVIIHPKIFFVPKNFYHRNTQNKSIIVTFEKQVDNTIDGTYLFKVICGMDFLDFTDKAKHEYLLSIG